MIDALVLLPVHDVSRNICPVDGYELLSYFDETYISGVYPAVTPDVPEVWNHHDATRAGDSRTNNIAESWNSMFKTLVGHKHPSVWSLIQGLRKDAADVSKNIRQAELGDPPQRRQLKASLATIHRRQRQLCDDYVAGNLTLAGFLRSAGKNIRYGRH